MRASHVMAYFREVGHWVDWDSSGDQFLFGDPHAEVQGIATAWIPTNEAIQEASDKGCNLFITHEPAFYDGLGETRTGIELAQRKRELLGTLGVTLLRCHDMWDLMPEFGIPDAWAAFLGFRTEPRPVDSYYKVCLVDSLSVRQTAQLIAEKVRALGQDTVLVFGDQGRPVRRMVVGTGAMTYLPNMYEMQPDVILATDDGMRFWNAGLWAADIDIPLLIVNHATAEKPGMQAMATYLTGVFPGTPVEYVDVRFPYSSIRSLAAS